MAEIPPWERPPPQSEQAAVPAAAPKDTRWKPGQSGNPKGRPKGALDKRHRLSAAMLDRGDEVVRIVIEKALEGDMQACGIVLSRIAPVLKAEGERVEFAFDPKGNQTEQVEQILSALSQGAMSAETAKQIIDAVAQLSGVRQHEEFEARLKALENRR